GGGRVATGGPKRVHGGGRGGAEPLEGASEMGERAGKGLRRARGGGEAHTEGAPHADSRRPAHDQRPDRVGHLLPRGARAIHLLDGQPGLVQQHQPRAVPPHRSDHSAASGRRARRSARESWPTRKSLSRLFAPLTRPITDAGTPKIRARSAVTARFASPSAGAAVTRTWSAVSRQPCTRLRRARG